jgi:hypothetical protein
LQFSLQAASPETFGCTLVYTLQRLEEEEEEEEEEGLWLISSIDPVVVLL